MSHGRVGRNVCVSGGFTLLEAVVALAIFSAGAMALYGLFNTNLITLSRAHETMDQAPYVDYAIDYLSAVNPRLRPEGQVDLGGFDVTWTATLVEPVRQSQNGNGFMGNFEVGLYEVAFEVRVLDLGAAGLAARATSLGVYRVRLVGFEKVRGLEASRHTNISSYTAVGHLSRTPARQHFGLLESRRRGVRERCPTAV